MHSDNIPNNDPPQSDTNLVGLQLWIAMELYKSLKLEQMALVSGVEPGVDPDDETMLDGLFNLFRVAGDLLVALRMRGVSIPHKHR